MLPFVKKIPYFHPSTTWLPIAMVAVILPSCVPRNGDIHQGKLIQPNNIEVRETNSPDGELHRREEGYVDDHGDFINHGLLTNFWKSGGKKSELHYVHNQRSGERLAWFEDGQKWSIGIYDENGKPHGAWLSWFPDGTPASEFHMDHGAYHGPYLEWHRNGQLRHQFEYVNGKKQGLETFWDEYGNIGRKIEWLNNIEQP